MSTRLSKAVYGRNKKIHIRFEKDKIYDSQNRTCKQPRHYSRSKSGKIERTMTQKYLGIIVNQKGDLEDHIKEKTKSATKILDQIRLTVQSWQ